MLGANGKDDGSWLKFLIIVVLASFLAAILSKEGLRQQIITFIAGICAGSVAILVCSIINSSPTTEVISVLISSSFISSIYPIIQRWAMNFTKKKLP